MHYFVLRKKCHGPEIERYDESKWNEIKEKVTNAIAVSTDFNDPAFDGYTKVIWDSVKNPFTKLNEKIWVTRYDDFSLMEKEAEKAKKEANKFAAKIQKISMEEGKITVNKDGIGKRIEKAELKSYIDKGWKIGTSKSK